MNSPAPDLFIRLIEALLLDRGRGWHSGLFLVVGRCSNVGSLVVWRNIQLGNFRRVGSCRCRRGWEGWTFIDADVAVVGAEHDSRSAGADVESGGLD